MREVETRSEPPYVGCYKFGTPLQGEGAVEAGEDAVAAEDLEQMIEARTDGAAGRSHAHGMHEQA